MLKEWEVQSFIYVLVKWNVSQRVTRIGVIHQ